MTATREALIEKLVISLHLSVPERRLLGSECVSVEEIADVVKRLLKQDGVFPPIARLWQPGELVFEGFFLVKHPDGKVQIVCQRSNPIRPTELADRTTSEYRTYLQLGTAPAHGSALFGLPAMLVRDPFG